MPCPPPVNEGLCPFLTGNPLGDLAGPDAVLPLFLRQSATSDVLTVWSFLSMQGHPAAVESLGQGSGPICPRIIASCQCHLDAPPSLMPTSGVCSRDLGHLKHFVDVLA